MPGNQGDNTAAALRVERHMVERADQLTAARRLAASPGPTLAERIAELAGSIAQQAQAIEEGTINGRLVAAAIRLAENIDTLKAWAELAEQQG